MEFIGIDTETINGKCRLIGLSSGEAIKVRSEKDIVSFLNKYRNGISFVAFNADYDIQSLITYFSKPIKQRLLYGILTRIINGGTVVPLTFIPKKYFKFGGSYIFDVQQFYSGSLATAAKKHLNQEKLGVDASNITEENIYSKEVIDYCINDARLAKELMDKFFKDLPPELKEVKPISPAFYSGSYFKREITPNVPPENVNALFRKAYFGGRFEVYKRGFFKKAFYGDINSAYPFEIAKLKTLRGAKYDFSMEYDPDADYSVYLVECFIKDDFLSPLVFKHKNLCFYPIGDYKGYITKGEFERIRKYKPKILNAMHVYCKAQYPFKDKVMFMYSKKQESDYSHVYKTLINSLYGRTAIAIKKWRKDPGLEDIYGIYTDPDSGETFYKVEDSFSSNFLYASEITARTRLRMYDIADKHRDSILAVQTDGFLSDKPIEVDESPLMGAWKTEVWEDLYLIGSGVYFYKKAGQLEGAFRGFRISEEKIQNIIKSILSSKANKVEFVTKKHYSIAESMRIHDEEKENLILEVVRSLDINFDRKRTWLSEWKKGKDILTKPITSKGILNVFTD